MNATITESYGFQLAHERLVEFEQSARFQLDTTLFLNTAGEPMLVVYLDGSWSVHSALEAEELMDHPEFHQSIPLNALLRNYIEFESAKPVIDIEFATPVPIA